MIFFQVNIKKGEKKCLEQLMIFWKHGNTKAKQH